ncbi:head completion adaptor [Vibrio phage 1.139.A._10N.261.48.C6]|nr:head completion adaptor [Vibrio phage 1.034.O._10N.261.46.B7]AUR83450.1 head completion adaptor [Vibrio phage 1.034.X._10N.261.46.B7]AUR90188.1 head completion adaptor [Vibrio phage 1.139.A._10N.261.48.C6]AUR90255.1 head completion adaptor [Vibrio phage 1.139.B._10N.261.48.C6]AUR95577.1 head completion adaptor [Vibrio phage 1.209.O._10N.222.52.B2]
MRYTNLQLLQKVARAINSDEVDTMDESLESMDIVDIMERSLDDILMRRHWEFMKDKQSVALTGNSAINVTLPDSVVRIQCIRHLDEGDQGQYVDLQYLEPADFTRRLQGNDASNSNTDEVLINGVKLWPRNDTAPRYYTSFDELSITVDSYDNTLLATGVDPDRIAIQGVHKPVLDFTAGTESVVQPIPEQMHNYWLNETIALCSVELRQQEHPRAERMARRAYIRLLDLEPVTRKDGLSRKSKGRTPRGGASRRKINIVKG